MTLEAATNGRRGGSDDDSDDDVHPHTESSPLLLVNDLPPEIVPSKRFQRKLELYCAAFLLILPLGVYLQVPPLSQLMEGIICKKFYPESSPVLRGDDENDDICKSGDVQDRLVMIKGWMSSFEALVALTVTVPYGIIADKYGRKPVLCLAMLGVCLAYTSLLVPLLFPDTFPLWTIILGVSFQLIGGGGPMIISMVWSMLADTIPLANRTGAFYRVTGVVMVATIATNPLAATLMRISPWLTICLGDAFLFMTLILTLFIPETLQIRRAADEQVLQRAVLPEEDDENDQDPAKMSVWRRAIETARNDTRHMWRFLLGSKPMLLIIVSFTLNILIAYLGLDMMMQYVHKRYDMPWSDATYLLTISPLVNIVLMLGVFPTLNWFLDKRGVDPIKRDLWLARVLSVLVVIGCFLIAFSFNLPEFIFSFFIFSLGGPFHTLARAVANAIIEPHTIGVLNTTIACVEQVGLLVSAPLLSWTMGHGMKAGGAWVGLPFMVATALAAVGSLMIMLFRLPRSTPQTTPGP